MNKVWVSLDRDIFTCPICLDLLKDPATIPCGHSFCMSCINRYWDKDGQKKGTYSCPQCRECLDQRPILRKNFMLTDAMGKVRDVAIQDPRPNHPYSATVYGSGSGAVEPYRAGKMSCLVSYRENPQPPAFNKDKLIKVTLKFHDMACPKQVVIHASMNQKMKFSLNGEKQSQSKCHSHKIREALKKLTPVTKT